MRYLGKSNRPSPYSSIQKDVRKFFSTFPYVLLIKNSKRIRCFCYDAKTGSVDTKCSSCLGIGWIPTIEKHRCWHNIAIGSDYLPNLITLIDPAAVAIDGKAFYFLPEANPEIGDYIVVAQFDKKGLPRYQTQQFYKIEYSDPRVDDHGNPVFCKASTSKDPIDAEIKSFNLYRVRNEIRIVPVS